MISCGFPFFSATQSLLSLHLRTERHTVYAGLGTLQAGLQYEQAHSRQWGVQTGIFLLWCFITCYISSYIITRKITSSIAYLFRKIYLVGSGMFLKLSMQSN